MANDSTELPQFQAAAMYLTANKLYEDYLDARELMKSLEPEGFVEHWIPTHTENITPELQKLIWKYFMINFMNKVRKLN